MNFENKPLSEMRESCVTIMSEEWDSLLSFLDRSDRFTALYDLKHSGLTILVDLHEKLVEEFFEENDLWGDLHSKVIEDKEEKKVQDYNSYND